MGVITPIFFILLGLNKMKLKYPALAFDAFNPNIGYKKGGMEIHFIVKSKEDIIDKEGFKKCVANKISEIIHDNYFLKNEKFKFKVEVKEV